MGVPITVDEFTRVDIDLSKAQVGDMLQAELANGQVLFFCCVVESGRKYLTFDERWLPEDLVAYSEQAAVEMIEIPDNDGGDDRTIEQRIRQSVAIVFSNHRRSVALQAYEKAHRKDETLTPVAFISRELRRNLRLGLDGDTRSGIRHVDLGRSVVVARLREPGVYEEYLDYLWTAQSPIIRLSVTTPQWADEWRSANTPS